jgi:hypothetical protein
MTWWEVEQIETYLTGLEEELEVWSLSNPEMRIEQKHVARVVEKLGSILPQISQVSKKTLVLQLSERAEVLQEYLKERLKREEANRYSPRNPLL